MISYKGLVSRRYSLSFSQISFSGFSPSRILLTRATLSAGWVFVSLFLNPTSLGFLQNRRSVINRFQTFHWIFNKRSLYSCLLLPASILSNSLILKALAD